MRPGITALACTALAACSSFGEDATPDSSQGPEAGVTANDGASDASAEAPPGVTTRFCPVADSSFCSDFEQGGLVDEWQPQALPVKFLTLDAAGDHGHALRVRLDSNSATAGKKETLDQDLGRPSTVTYAFDLRVDQSATKQVVEIASVRTKDGASTLAFHVRLEQDDIELAEYSKLPSGSYKVTRLLKVDGAWHRVEVKIVYAVPAHLTVRVDGRVVADQNSTVDFSVVPSSDRVLSVGVQDLGEVDGHLAYAIDNVTVFTQ
jgi:hypothetical protein